MIIVLGSAWVTQGKGDEAVVLGLEQAAHARLEDGCIAYDCFYWAPDPQVVQFVAIWRDMAALRAHFALPRSRTFSRKIALLAETRPTVRVFEANEYATTFVD